MSSIAPPYPLSSYPQDIQERVLEFFTPADLSHLNLVSKSEKQVVDTFQLMIQKKALKKEGANLGKQIADYLITVQETYKKLCERGEEAGGPDQKYDEMLSIFNHFKAKCGRFLPELPSHREDSFGLLFSIRDQHPSQMVKMPRENFDNLCSTRWGIERDSFDLVDIQRASNLFNGEMTARVYNSTLMGEFVERSLDEIEDRSAT